MFGGSKRAAAAACVGALAAVVAFAGCADDDGDSTAAQDEPGADVAFSAAAEPPKVFLNRTAKLLETARSGDDCVEIEQINQHSFSRFPCPPSRALSKSMAAFKVVDAKEYGTAAVVDYESGGAEQGAAILLFVAPDRKWGISRFGIITPPSTKTSDEDARDGYEETVDAYLEAVRERDCEAFREIVSIPSQDVDPCETVFPSTKNLAKQMKGDPDAEPRYLGGNGTFGFYSMETVYPVPEMNNTTISLMKAPEGSDREYLVLDAAPSVTTEEQERVRRAYRIQQEDARKERQKKEKDGVGSKKPLPPEGQSDN